jgi:hypothetical protein
LSLAACGSSISTTSPAASDNTDNNARSNQAKLQIRKIKQSSKLPAARFR